MIPLTVDVPMKRLPWANGALILATVIVSVAVPYLPGQAFAFFPAGDPHSELSPLVLQPNRFAAYQLVTSLFQHAGLIHLIGNMVFLFVFGNAINAKLGHLGFLAAYLGIGVLESLIWLAVGGGRPCLGASAAIMGLAGMFLVLYPLNTVNLFWDELDLAVLTRSWTVELPGWAVVLLFLLFDIWGALFRQNAGVAYLGHIVGSLAGIGLAVALLQTGRLVPDPGEQTLPMWLAGEGPAGRSGKEKKARAFQLKRKG